MAHTEKFILKRSEVIENYINYKIIKIGLFDSNTVVFATNDMPNLIQ
jgi:hypothetical protein